MERKVEEADSRLLRPNLEVSKFIEGKNVYNKKSTNRQ